MSDDELGAIDYLAVEFPAGRLTAEEFALLLEAVNRRSIRVLDLEFIAKQSDGTVKIVPLHELDGASEIDLDIWEGATSDLLDESDIAEIGSAIRPGHLAGVVIYENLWMLSLADALREHGARLILDGRIQPDEIVAALELTKPGPHGP